MNLNLVCRYVRVYGLFRDLASYISISLYHSYLSLSVLSGSLGNPPISFYHVYPIVALASHTT